MKDIKLQNKLASPVFWVGLGSALLLLAQTLGFNLPIDDATIKAVVNGVFGILALFGVGNNPSIANKF